MHHYPFHPGDYLLATCHLEPLHDLCYRRLLDYYYAQEKPLPTGTEWLAKRIRLPQDVLDDVLKEFFKETPDGWTHTRCDEEIASYTRVAETRKLNGMKGGRKTKTGSKPKANRQLDLAKAKITDSGSSSGSSSLNGNEGGGRKGKVDWVEKIVKAYPRSDAPMEVMAFVRDALNAGDDPQIMWDRVRECAAHMARAPAGAANSLFPAAKTFFGERRWEQPEVIKARAESLLAATTKGKPQRIGERVEGESKAF